MTSTKRNKDYLSSSSNTESVNQLEKFMSKFYQLWLKLALTLTLSPQMTYMFCQATV